jgi:hypothetical protein
MRTYLATQFREGMTGFLWGFIAPWKWLRPRIGPTLATVVLVLVWSAVVAALIHFEPQITAFAEAHPPPDPMVVLHIGLMMAAATLALGFLMFGFSLVVMFVRDLIGAKRDPD